MPRPKQHPLTKSEEPADPVKAGQAGETTDNPSQKPLGSLTIKGEGKANTVGLFQTAPDVKEYMTAEEARSKGFYVAPTEDEKAKGKKRG